ncbi:MAG: DUF2878 domain-containing protein [Pseudomonadota bacterium]
MSILWNFLALKVGWIISVSAAAHGVAWIGPLLVAVFVSAYLLLSERRTEEFLLVCAAVFMGTVWETFIIASGTIDYAGFSSALPPPWIIGLWALFAISLTRSLAWMQTRLLLAATVGGLIVPASYLAGAALGAAAIPAPLPFFLLQAIGWAILLPGLLWIARNFVTQTSYPDGDRGYA